MPTVVREWLSRCCTFKQQTVLITALRGCDGLPREDVSKHLTRELRRAVLLAADTTGASEFMLHVVSEDDVQSFVGDLDQYPMHWLMHFTHAAEVIAYKHPDAGMRGKWLGLYYRIVAGLHLRPETEEEMDERLADNQPERE